MFIQNANKYIDRVIHNDTVHAVVEGIADVPNEVRDHLVKYPEWTDVVDKVDDKVLKALDKAKKEIEKLNGKENEQQNADDNTDNTDNTDKTE